jgi:hypothetical protein
MMHLISILIVAFVISWQPNEAAIRLHAICAGKFIAF